MEGGQSKTSLNERLTDFWVCIYETCHNDDDRGTSVSSRELGTIKTPVLIHKSINGINERWQGKWIGLGLVFIYILFYTLRNLVPVPLFFLQCSAGMDCGI